MALRSLSQLDGCKAVAFPPGYPENIRTFYSPVDDVHGALETLLGSARHSLVLGMYGYTDAELDAAVRKATAHSSIYVQLSLDRSQSGGASEAALLKQWDNTGPGNSIAIGNSERGAIMHLKLAIIDGLDVVGGSTNWSLSGETKQDNQLTVVRDSLVAAEARSRLDVIHDHMLKQMSSARRRR